MAQLEKRIAMWAGIIASIAAVVTAVIQYVPWSRRPPDPAALNRRAYEQARRAPLATTFRDARNLLAQIDMREVTDPDLREYIQYMLDLSTVCIELNISRETEVKLRSLLASLDLKALYSIVVRNGVGDAMEEAKKLFGKITSLYARIDRFEELETAPREALRLTLHCSGPRCAGPLNLVVRRLRSPRRTVLRFRRRPAVPTARRGRPARDTLVMSARDPAPHRGYPKEDVRLCDGDGRDVSRWAAFLCSSRLAPSRSAYCDRRHRPTKVRPSFWRKPTFRLRNFSITPGGTGLRTDWNPKQRTWRVGFVPARKDGGGTMLVEVALDRSCRNTSCDFSFFQLW